VGLEVSPARPIARLIVEACLHRREGVGAHFMGAPAPHFRIGGQAVA